jgi:Protein of unknown function (DUF3892)
VAKVYITAIELSGGTLVRHIINIWYGPNKAYTASDTKTSTADMASLIERKVHDAWVHDPANRQEAEVIVVSPLGRPKYLRTKPDDDPNDNLLKLPKK